jgi:hypothetical protein
MGEGLRSRPNDLWFWPAKKGGDETGKIIEEVGKGNKQPRNQQHQRTKQARKEGKDE